MKKFLAILVCGALAAVSLAASSSPADATPRLYKIFKKKKPVVEVKLPSLAQMKEQIAARCKASKNEARCSYKAGHHFAALERRSVCKGEVRKTLEAKGVTEKALIKQELVSTCNYAHAAAIHYLYNQNSKKKKRA